MKSPLVAEILPTPQECRWSGGAIKLSREFRILHPVCASEADVRSARLLAAKIAEATGLHLRVAETTRYVNRHVLFVSAGGGRIGGGRAGGDVPALPLDFVPPHQEGYGLRVDGGGITLAGADSAGLFYAVQTLAQVLRFRAGKAGGAAAAGAAGAKNPLVPCVDIRDWPAMRHRAMMIDIARQVEREDWIEEMVRRLAACKMNMFVLYFEDKFRWKKWAPLSHPFGYTPADVRRLAKACEENHVEFVPALASLGHCENILGHPEIAHLREDGAIYQLTLRNAGTRRLLEGLYAEILPLYRGRYWHVNCDESPMLRGAPGSPKSYFRESLRLFTEHLIFLGDLLARNGKEMMVWGDMLLHHPEIMDGLPRDIIVVDWDYGSMKTRRREGPKIFREKGFRVMVAPAAERSAEVCYPQQFLWTENIPYFIRHGIEEGAIGVMNTAWEMFTTNSIVAWPGMMSSAQYAWNPGAIEPEKICPVLARHLHGPEAAADVNRSYADLSSDRFLDRYKLEAENPATRKFRTYHLDSHEFIATDPMVFLKYEPATWAAAVARQASRGVADLDRALPKARWGQLDLQVSRVAGQVQAFHGRRRVAVNEAGLLALKAERLRRSARREGDRAGKLKEAGAALKQAADVLGDLGKQAGGLMGPVRKTWAVTRHVDDPGLEEGFMRRLRLTRDSALAHADRIRAAAAELARGRDVEIDSVFGGQPVLVIQADNPIDWEIDLLKPRISMSADRKEWRLAAHKNWFLLSKQRYIAAIIPQAPRADCCADSGAMLLPSSGRSMAGKACCAKNMLPKTEAWHHAARRTAAKSAAVVPGSSLPKFIRIHVTRTHVDPRHYPLADRFRVLAARTLSPGEILDGPPKADIETTDWRLVYTPNVKYRRILAEPWVMEYELVP